MGQHRVTTAAALTALASLVALAGCSVAVPGNATAATHLVTSSANPAPSGAGSSAPTSPPSMSSAESSSGDAGATDVPPQTTADSGSTSSSTSSSTALDRASVTWLAEFCTGFSDVASQAGPNTTGMSNDEIVREIVHAYSAMSAAARRAETDLRKLPEPTFPGEQRIVPAAIDWFQAVNTVYGQGAHTIAGTRFSSLAQLSAAIDAVEAGMDDPNTKFSVAVGRIDPSVTEAMRSLPQCARLVDASG